MNDLVSIDGQRATSSAWTSLLGESVRSCDEYGTFDHLKTVSNATVRLHEAVGHHLRFVNIGSGTQHHNQLNAAYIELLSALDVMRNADELESYFIDEDTYNSALSFANLMRLFDVPAPKAFAHGGDAVTFVWDRGGGRRYVTVGGNAARYLDVVSRGQVSCEAKAFFSAADYPLLMSVLGGNNWSSRATF